MLTDEKIGPQPFLQRKHTIGLASTPGSTRIASAQPTEKKQAVMFMNDILYNGPGLVRTIMKGAPKTHVSAHRLKQSAKTPETSQITEFQPGGSIIHTLQPYKENPDGNQDLFSSSPSPQHKHTTSESSIQYWASDLMSYLASPTQLPHVHVAATIVAKLKRLLPNETRSMTFEEKIQLLFPGPPGARIVPNRRLSVPSLPRMSSVSESEPFTNQSHTLEELQSRRASKRTTIDPLEKVPALVESSKADPAKTQEHRTYRLIADAYRDLTKQVGKSWKPGVPGNEDDFPSLGPDVTDVDSDILQNSDKSDMTDSGPSDMSNDHGRAESLGSGHLNVPAIDLSKLRRNAISTCIQGSNVQTRAGTLEEVKSPRGLGEEELYLGEEVITVMLDSDGGGQLTVKSWELNPHSFFLDADQSLPGDKAPITSKIRNHRVGDELLTFSERMAGTRSRKGPPPTPLLLHNLGRGASIILRGSEPSGPNIGSPGGAVAEIEAQLRRLEKSRRESAGSLLHRIPDTDSSES